MVFLKERERERREREREREKKDLLKYTWVFFSLENTTVIGFDAFCFILSLRLLV